MESLLQDLRYAVRVLMKSPAFTLVAVLTLALGIGANTAIFSLLDGLLLRPLPVEHPEQLVLFGTGRNWGMVSGVTKRYDVFSHLQYRYFHDENHFFPGGVAAFASWQSPVRVRWSGTPVMVNSKMVSGNYFSTLGVPAAAGRLFTAADDRPESAPVAVLSYRYWNSKFDRDPSILGRAVDVNGTAFTVIGVAAAPFFGESLESDPADVWFPIARFAQVTLQPSVLNEPDARWLWLIGRAAPNANLQQITAGLTVQLHQWLLAHDENIATSAEERDAVQNAVITATSAATGVSHLRRKYSDPLKILAGIVGLVLAIACANIANLLLARATVRRREISVRLALGATRGRLLRQLLTESVLLSLLGGVAGVLLAFAATHALMALVFRDAQTYAFQVPPDLRLLAFAAAISLLSGVLFGVAPALRAARLDVIESIKSGARTAGIEARGRFSTGKALVAGQVAISLVLLVGAGLFVRSLARLARQDFGFTPEHVLLVKVDPRVAGYKPAQLAGLYQRLQRSIDAQPGVRNSALALYTPLSGDNWSGNVALDDFTPEQNKHAFSAWVSVTPGYFETMGIPLLLGRTLNEQDTGEGPRAAVVNESFAHTYFKDKNPVGRRFGFSQDTKADWEIVGVVKDTKHVNPREGGEITFFLPVVSKPGRAGVLEESSYLTDLVVRGAGDPGAVANEVRQAIRSVDDNIPILRVTTMSEQVSASFNQEELVGVLSTVFGAVALLLACVGLYGLMAYAVARRTNEIGVRMALGARREDVLRMILGETLTLVAIGVAIGVPLVAAGIRMVRSQLFEVVPYDPVTLAGAAAILLAIAAISGFIPARRATQVEPMTALRDE